MGLSNSQKYEITNHFELRAKERFGIDKKHLKKWVNQNVHTLTPYNNGSLQTPNSRLYISDQGVVFVCDEVNHNFVTCYEANDTLQPNKKTTIHEHNLELYQTERDRLIHKYRLKDAKELLKNIDDHIEQFYELSKKLTKGRLTAHSVSLIDQLIEEYHVIKATMRTIETKSDEFD